MATAEDDLPLPPKDEFEDGSDAQLLANDKDPSANNQPEAANVEAPLKEPYKGRTVSWKYVWVKSPSLFQGLPPVYTKKWVRTITDPPGFHQDPQFNSAPSERSDYPDNRSEGHNSSEQAHNDRINGNANI